MHTAYIQPPGVPPVKVCYIVTYKNCHILGALRTYRIFGYTQHLCDVQIYILLVHFTCVYDGSSTIYILLRIPLFCFVFFFLKNFEKYLNDTMLCTKGHVCDIEHIIYILCKNAYGHFAILVQEIFMLMSSCISTIERIFLMNFSIRNYSSCPIIGESHNICVSCSCPWAVPFSFSFFTFLTISTL